MNEVPENPADKAKQDRALESYEDLVSKVYDLKAMSETKAYRRFVSHCKREMEEAKAALLIAEKPREIVFAQAEVKVIKSLLRSFGEPVDDLKAYIAANPLFAPDMKTRAKWNAELCDVEIVEIGTPQQEPAAVSG